MNQSRDQLLLGLFVLVCAMIMIFSWLILGKTDLRNRQIEKQRVDHEATSTFDAFYLRTKIDDLIEIGTLREVKEKRKQLVEFLWGLKSLPTSMPDAVDFDHQDDRYSDLNNLLRIDRLIVQMEYGLKSVIYHFIPENSNSRVILYHQGHAGDIIAGRTVIKAFLDRGYAVVGFSMPLLGGNNKPDVELKHLGWFQLERHEEMKLLTPKRGHPLKFFIEPVLDVINYLEANFDYEVLSMTGISGGGWATTIAAAVDDRIIASFPVAGTVPIYLRSGNSTDFGDWEQTVPEFLWIANYLELYILGATGRGRSQTQILNVYDSCCFSGASANTYHAEVRSRVKEIGSGEFDLKFDLTHKEHAISSWAVDIIDDKIANLTNRLQ
jgi:hypothetical protein